jgi:L,D-transpeptidase catalytic domain
MTVFAVKRAGLLVPLMLLSAALLSSTEAVAVPDPQSGGGNSSMTTTAPVAEAPPAPKPIVVTLTADVNLTSQQMTVSSGGKVLHVWPISSGRQGYETPRGNFRPQWAAKMHFSKQYDDAPMPHSVFFNGGIATHATQATGMLGRPASHGCVRLSAAAAATFYSLVHKHGYQATRIVVRGTPKFRNEEVASRRNRDDGSNRVAQRQVPAGYGGYRYAQPAYSYGYAPTYGYGYGAPRQVYIVRPSGYGPSYGQLRYTPQGYVRY